MQHKASQDEYTGGQAPYGRRVAADGESLEDDVNESQGRALARQLRSQGSARSSRDGERRQKLFRRRRSRRGIPKLGQRILEWNSICRSNGGFRPVLCHHRLPQHLANVSRVLGAPKNLFVADSKNDDCVSSAPSMQGVPIAVASVSIKQGRHGHVCPPYELAAGRTLRERLQSSFLQCVRPIATKASLRQGQEVDAPITGAPVQSLVADEQVLRVEHRDPGVAEGGRNKSVPDFSVYSACRQPDE